MTESLPSGLVTFLLTDIVGSARLWETQPEAMSAAMQRHDELVEGAVSQARGRLVKPRGEGDSRFAVFASAHDALEGAALLDQALRQEAWRTSRPIQVRMAVHTGEAELRAGDYYGDAVNRCARLRSVAHPGQVLVTSSTVEQAQDGLPAGLVLTDLGEHRLKDLSRGVQVFQLTSESRPAAFPPLLTLDRERQNLPVQLSSFIGRDNELRQVVDLVREHRLVTVTGFGGMGKTRLALQAAAELVGSGLEVWFVDLVAVHEPALVPARIAEALGVRCGETDPAEAVIAALQEMPTLLVLDNLEQVLGCAGFVADLLAHTQAVRVLATSREPLHVRGERQVALPPLSLPPADLPTDQLSTSEAVRLFTDRALAVRRDFLLDELSAPTVAAVCARLEGHPLALELAAARLKVLSVDKLLSRMDSALALLTGGSRDAHERHQTLRATITWSFDSLTGDERLLLTRIAALPAPASYQTVEEVCGQGLDVLDLLESLVDKSLVTTTELDGDLRYGLLVSIRQYAAEHLDPDALRALQERHADHVQRALSAYDEFVLVEYQELHAYVGRELVHVRAALDHRRLHGPRGSFATLVCSLSDTLFHRGLIRENLELAQAALEDTDDPDLTCSLRAGEMLSAVEMATRKRPPRELLLKLIESAGPCKDPSLRANALVFALYAIRTRAEFDELLVQADAAIADMPAHAAPMMRLERNKIVASLLRFVEPETAEAAARDRGRHGPLFDLVDTSLCSRLAEVLLDRGDGEEAVQLLAEMSEDAITGTANPGLGALISATRARALTQCGRLDEARHLLADAFDKEILTGEPAIHAALALVELERAAGHPEAVVDAVDALLASLPDTASETHGEVEDDEPGIVSLRWRRAVALRQLGRLGESAAELGAARQFFAESELFGPRELLGILVERAVQVADQEPERAASLVAAVQARRGRWVLPFGMDAELSGLLARLPGPADDPPDPTEAW